jgi:heat-inducible transcriptional repressor
MREQTILKDIIHTYVLSGEPVSSRTVSKHTQHGLSAASIRNVMADLEDLGLLCQPHTSAGRIPTEAGYRLYVETLMTRSSLPAHDKRYIEERLRDAGDADQMMAAITHLLSEMSDQVGVVLTPAVEEISLKSADFVPLGRRRVLCVLVSASGFVDNVVVTTEEELSREDLVRMSNYVTSSFAGKRLRKIREDLLRLMADEKSAVDTWLSGALRLAQQALHGSAEQEVLLEGASSLLGRPELADVERVRRMLDTFADKARLVNLLSSCLESEGGVRVFIGKDSEVTSELDFSMVATTYGSGEGALGSLGVIGPSRMEYPRMVPLVRHLGKTLSRALAKADADPRTP